MLVVVVVVCAMSDRTAKDGEIDRAIEELIHDDTESFFLVTTRRDGKTAAVRWYSDKDIYSDEKPPQNLMMLYTHCNILREEANEMSEEPHTFEDLLDTLFGVNVQIETEAASEL